MIGDGTTPMVASAAGTLPVARWRLLALFVRARGMLMSAALLLVTCGLLALLEEWAGKGAIRQALLMQLVPVLVAALIGVSAWSPFGESERTAARSLPALRGVHIGSMLMGSVGLSVWLVSRWSDLAQGIDTEAIVARNIIGFAGAALVVGRLVDARLSWIAPLVLGILASSYILSVGGNDLDRMWTPDVWLWSGRSDDALSSWIIALGVGLGGFAWCCWSGPKDVAGEEA